ncbi:serine/threonine-protein kinase [Corallococcus sp. BB11-1]|uniref:serine/threonine-protein kinase n=1 Tax=Corallococcus sp. BB11-1 TaxID=2996783 RepID=UPI00226D66E5|nr:serine/threonine-protein kinase [Corallococcus sp. BB11-1]MCY1035920.1 serine/threonine-protein kinase [Corallococcus sp. BB11-1]
MTSYTMLHLALTGAFVVLALVHFATWAAVRSQRVQLWLASSFLGFAAISFSVGVASSEASAMVRDTRPWLLLGVLTSIPLPYTLLRVLWSLLDLPLTRWRRVMLGVTVALGAVRVADVALSLRVPDATALTSEQLSRATAGLGLPLFWVLAVVVGGTWAVEATRLLKRRGAMAVAVLVASLCALGLLGRELAVDLGWSDGLHLFALIGLPFLLLSSTALAILTARSLRGADLGTGIHRYRRLARLGRGGMGEVWLAVRTGRAGFHRLVVLKRMLDGAAEEAEVRMHRFIGEARTAARLHHPNIVSVHDLGQLDGAWFIVMEYLSGVNVFEFIKRARKGGPLPLEVIVAVCQQALRGLAYAHERGVTHRDISPDNLVVSFDGVVKVVDFGIAQGADALPEAFTQTTPLPAGSRLTQEGGIIGKLPYMPPERIEGAEATPSGDLFALGCILYELLARTVLHAAPTSSQLPALERPESPIASRVLRGVLETALQPRPELRFADAKAFLLALEPARQVLPAVDLADWLRENFAERWAREQALVELSDPSPTEVEALLKREPRPRSTARPASPELAAPTEVLAPPPEVSETVPMKRPS